MKPQATHTAAQTAQPTTGGVLGTVSVGACTGATSGTAGVATGVTSGVTSGVKTAIKTAKKTAINTAGTTAANTGATTRCATSSVSSGGTISPITPTSSASPALAPMRAMTSADIDAVLAVEVRAYGHPWSRGNFADPLKAGYVCEVQEHIHEELDATAGRGAAAAGLHTAGIRAYWVVMAGVGELHLLNITVAPEHQGQGVGKALLKRLQQRCQQQGVQQLWLEVRHSNKRARALYQRLGFEAVGVRKAYYPAHPRREDAVVMRWTLPNSLPNTLPNTLPITQPDTQPIKQQITQQIKQPIMQPTLPNTQPNTQPNPQLVQTDSPVPPTPAAGQPP